MHILFLTDNFPPEVNAPASRTFEHCREWVKAGHRVTVITTAPNFPKGRVFPGYRNKLWQSESMDGIRVIRVWTYITANEGFGRRVLDYVSFMISAVIAAVFVRRVDVVIGTSPQFFTACAAWIVSVYKWRPFVFELRDLWPESIRVVGAMKSSWLLDMLERVELFLYRRAARVVSVTQAFKRNLVSRGIDADKIRVVTNGVDISRFVPQPRDPELVRELGLEGRFVAGYIGTHGLAHALETVLEAARIAQSEGDNSVAFVLLGDGARKAELKQQAKEMGLTNVHFVDSVSKDQVPRYWALLDVAIIHLRRTPLFETVIPSKLFECMGMGIPILHGVAGESAEIVQKEEVGIVFTPENPAELLEGLRKLQNDRALYSRLRANGPKAAHNYDRVTLANLMLKSLLDISSLSVPAETRPMKVLLLNQVFWPDVAATAQHGHDLARYLVEHGDQVTALASRSIYGESGRTLPKEDTVDGIRVVRVARSVFGKKGIAGRAFDFVSFYGAALTRSLFMAKQDVVVCLTTPPFIALVGLILKWTKGTRFVFWTMDLYPEVPVAAGVLRTGSIAHRFFEALDHFCLRRADTVVVLGRCMRERVLAKGVDPERVEMINVWADPTEVRDIPRGTSPYRQDWSIGDRFVVEYSGNFGIGHDEATIFDAMRRMRDDDRVRWAMVGGGTKKAGLESFVRNERIGNAVIQPYQPRSRLADLISLGDVHLVTVAEGFEGLMVPSKFYGVLAAARPTIYIGPESSEVATVIREEKCGVVVRQGDGAGLAEAVRWLAAEPAEARAMGQRGRAALEKRYSMPIACARWQRMLHRTVSGRR